MRAKEAPAFSTAGQPRAGRASARLDLLLALRLQGPVDWFPLPGQESVARGAGFERQQETPVLPDMPPLRGEQAGDAPAAAPASSFARLPLRMPHAWIAEVRKAAPESDADAPEAAATSQAGAAAPQPTEDDANAFLKRQQAIPPRRWAALAGLLRERMASAQKRGARIDWPAWVARIARLQPLAPVPRIAPRRWPANATVLLDGRSASLTPFTHDMEALVDRLQCWVGHRALRVRVLEPDPLLPPNAWRARGARRAVDGGAVETPGFGARAGEGGDWLILVSDLGLGRDGALRGHASAQAPRRRGFVQLLDRLQASSVPVLTLAPVPRQLFGLLPRNARALPWSDAGLSGTPSGGGVEPAALRDLLALLAIFHRVGDALLRALRLLVPGAEAETEWWAWNHADVEVQGRTLRLSDAAQARHAAHLRTLPPALVVRALRTAGLLAAGWDDGIRHARTVLTALALAPRAAGLLAAEAAHARAVIDSLPRGPAARGDADRTRLQVAAAWLIDSLPSAAAVARDSHPALQRLARFAYAEAMARGEAVAVRPELGIIRPSGATSDPAEPEVPWRLAQDGNALWLVPRDAAGTRALAATLCAEAGQSAASLGALVDDGERAWWMPMTDQGTRLLDLGAARGPVRIQLGAHQVELRLLQRPCGVRGWAASGEGAVCEMDGPGAGAALPWMGQAGVEVVASGSGKCVLRYGVNRYGAYLDLVMRSAIQRFRYLEPGVFQMGSPDGVGDADERPRHEVRLTRGLWLGDTPCTQELWEAVLGGNPSEFKGARRPVESVSWDDVQGFLGRLGGWMPAGWEAVLPTEVQWEYACRAGTDGAYWWGVEAGQGKMNARESGPGETSEVKGYEANEWGLYDMHGNVWEWCADGLRKYRRQVETDPEGPVGEADHRAVRGGSWIGSAVWARAACRVDRLRGRRVGDLGFRFALRYSGPGGSGKPSGAGPARAERAPDGFSQFLDRILPGKWGKKTPE